MAEQIGLVSASVLQDVFATGRVNPALEDATHAVQQAINTLIQYNESNRVIAGGHLEGVLLSLLIPVLAEGLEALGVGTELALMLSKGAIGLLKGDVVSLLFDAAWPASEAISPDPHFSETSLRSALEFTINQFVSGRAVLNSRRPVRNVRRIADPVAAYRGEFERGMLDLLVKGAGIDFSLKRTYQSRVLYFGTIGPGWDHGYNLRLREESDYVLIRLTGQLGEERYVRHPRFNEAAFNYFVPPNGVHNVIIPTVEGAFLLRRPQGEKYFYEATDQPHEHRLRRIEDRFGNYLDFKYTLDEGLLERVVVNSDYRFVDFRYDELQRLEEVEDHSGRVVRYSYDDWGYLCSVTGPSVSRDVLAIREWYEYGQVGPLRRLTRVWNSRNQILVENEYDNDPRSDYFGCLTRQVQNRGETQLFYESLTGEVDPTLPEKDLPSLRVLEARRNGHQIERIFNSAGNELLLREQFADTCGLRETITRSRYNEDGQLIARVDPDGAVIQYLYGRDHVADSLSSPELDSTFGNVTMAQRMSYGNLLATVTRARRVTSDYSMLDPGFWKAEVPPVKWSGDPDDIVTKSTYDPDSQLCLSRSDPRHTISADPMHVESAMPGDAAYDPTDARYRDHQRFLTFFEYGPGPRFEVQRTISADRTRPDGSVVRNIIDQVLRYDGSGRILTRVDPLGREWFNEYFPHSNLPAERVKEGFLHRQLKPHVDLPLDSDLPKILEVSLTGNWVTDDRHVMSSGIAGDRMRISVYGASVVLYQSSSLVDRLANNDQVQVVVDGVERASWDQTQDAQYLIPDLTNDMHVIEIVDTVSREVSVGRVRSHVAFEFDVDDLGQVVTAIDGRGALTSTTFDAMGQKTKITTSPAENPSTIEYTYDEAGRRIRERREWRDETGQLRPEAGVVYLYTYDTDANQTSASIAPEDGSEARTSYSIYDANDNLRLLINPRGVRTYLSHDGLGRQTGITRALCSPDASSRSFTYDLAGHLLSQRGPLGGLTFQGYRDRAGNWQSAIDPHGRVRVVTDPLGNFTVTDYDKLDRPTVIRQFQIRPDNGVELLSRRVTDYDELGSAIRVTEAVFANPIVTIDPIDNPDQEFHDSVNAGNVQNSVTEQYLDAAGNALETTKPDGGVWRQRFDGGNRIYDQTDAEGTRTLRVFDGTGNVTRSYSIETVRDPQTGDPVGVEVFLDLQEFDLLNRLTARIDPYGNRWEQKYDSLGNRTVLIDPLGNITRFRFNAFAEIVAQVYERTETGASAGAPLPPLTTESEYDANGNCVAVIDAVGRRTEFVYDSLDRLIESRFAIGPHEPVELRRYDAAGNLAELQDRNGLVHLLTYDLLNRRIREEIDDHSVAPRDRIAPSSATFASFQYDASGRFVEHRNDFCITELHRDSRGLVLIEEIVINIPNTAPQAFVVSRNFDVAGRRTSLTYPSGRRVDCQYDLLGRIRSIRNIFAPPDYPGRASNRMAVDLARYRYTGVRMAAAELGNSLTLSFLYDARGQVLERSLSRPDGMVIWRNQKIRDAAGKIGLENTSTRHGERSRRYGYDSVYRLISYAEDLPNWIDPDQVKPPAVPIEPGTTQGQALLDAAIGAVPGITVFEYDDVGNRLHAQEPNLQPVVTVPNQLNEYTSTGGVPWSYDTNGNLRSDAVYYLGFDGADALQQIVETATGSAETYYRDAVGRVVGAVTGAGRSIRVHDSDVLLMEVMGSARIEHTVNHLTKTVVHSANGGEDYWLVRDDVGSLRVLSDALGIVVSMPTYRPFGAPEDGELALSPLRWAFGGMEASAVGPFLHSQTRTYRHDVGRYCQRDPARLAGRNQYSYAENNPIDRWDPTGLEDEPGGVRLVDLYNPKPLSLGDFRLNVDFEGLLRPSGPSFWDVLMSQPAFDAYNYYAGEWYGSAWYNPLKYLNGVFADAYFVIGGLTLATDAFLGAVGAGINWVDPHGDLNFVLMMTQLDVQGTPLYEVGPLSGGLNLSLTATREAAYRWASALARVTLWSDVPHQGSPALVNVVERGWYIEMWNMMRGRSNLVWAELLQKNYPAFDFFGIEYAGIFDSSGTSVRLSLKSIDLTLPTAQTETGVYNAVSKELTQLVNTVDKVAWTGGPGAAKDVLWFQYVGQFPTLAQERGFAAAAQLTLLNGVELRVSPFIRGF